MKPVQRILLCGFMGCGKTSVGQALAFRLKWDFLDTDAMIEKREGIPIPQIFQTKGEEYFRQAETAAAAAVARRKNVVVSTGGGFVMRDENLSALLAYHPDATGIVYLDCDFDTCYQRICTSSRPLVVSNTKEQLREIFQSRADRYRSVSTIQVHNDSLVSDAVEEIIRQLPI